MSTSATGSSAVGRLARARTGQRLAGYIYGTIVTLSVIVAGARAYPHSSGHIAALVAVTCGVFWIAHVYAHGLGHSLELEEHLTLDELLRIARREGSIVEAAVPPVLALLLGTFGLVSDPTAAWIAFALGLLVLAAEGLIFARVERLGVLGTFAVVAANVGLGLLLVALKLVVTHH